MTHAVDLPPADRAYQQAHYNQTKQPLYYGIYAMLLFLALVSTALRIWSRRISKLKLGPDDVASIIATLLLTGVFILNFQSVTLGKGRHDITITDAEWNEQAKNQFGANLLYTTTWPTIKISILLLYRRIFIMRWFTVINWFMLTLLGIYIVSTVLVDIFSCNPIDKTWSTDPNAPGHCINFMYLYQVTAGANVAIDLIILLMPQIPIWRLRMRFVERLGLAAIFGLGIISCLSSIMRIVTTARVDNNDVNYQAVGPNLWTANELATSLMCANLPCILPCVLRINRGMRRLWGSMTGSQATSSTEVSDSHFTPFKSIRLRENVQTSSNLSQTSSGQRYGLPKEKTATFKSNVEGGNRFGSLPEQESGIPHNSIGVEQEVKWNEDGKESTSS